MEATLRQLFTWNNLRKDVERHVRTCRTCQLCKKNRKKYGHVPPKEAEQSIPWNRVNVDMIGPLSVKTPDGKTHQLQALTMIDPATGWFEVKDVKTQSSTECMNAFDDNWLSRYPRPQYIGYDDGSEYKKYFKQMCDNYGLHTKPSTAYNAQSNGIVENAYTKYSTIL